MGTEQNNLANLDLLDTSSEIKSETEKVLFYADKILAKYKETYGENWEKYEQAKKEYEDVRKATKEALQSERAIIQSELEWIKKEVEELDDVETILDKGKQYIRSEVQEDIEEDHKSLSIKEVQSILKEGKQYISNPYIQNYIDLAITNKYTQTVTDIDYFLLTLVEKANPNNTFFSVDSLHNTAQDMYLKRIVWEKWYSSEYIQGYNNTESNYLLTPNDTEAVILQAENIQKIDSLLLVNYINYLANTWELLNLWRLRAVFSNEKLSELMDLFKNWDFAPHIQNKLEASGLPAIMEKINNATESLPQMIKQVESMQVDSWVFRNEFFITNPDYIYTLTNAEHVNQLLEYINTNNWEKTISLSQIHPSVRNDIRIFWKINFQISDILLLQSDFLGDPQHLTGFLSAQWRFRLLILERYINILPEEKIDIEMIQDAISQYDLDISKSPKLKNALNKFSETKVNYETPIQGNEQAYWEYILQNGSETVANSYISYLKTLSPEAQLVYIKSDKLVPYINYKLENTTLLSYILSIDPSLYRFFPQELRQNKDIISALLANTNIQIQRYIDFIPMKSIKDLLFVYQGLNGNLDDHILLSPKLWAMVSSIANTTKLDEIQYHLTLDDLVSLKEIQWKLINNKWLILAKQAKWNFISAKENNNYLTTISDQLKTKWYKENFYTNLIEKIPSLKNNSLQVDSLVQITTELSSFFNGDKVKVAEVLQIIATTKVEQIKKENKVAAEKINIESVTNSELITENKDKTLTLDSDKITSLFAERLKGTKKEDFEAVKKEFIENNFSNLSTEQLALLNSILDKTKKLVFLTIIKENPHQALDLIKQVQDGSLSEDDFYNTTYEKFEKIQEKEKELETLTNLDNSKISDYQENTLSYNDKVYDITNSWENYSLNTKNGSEAIIITKQEAENIQKNPDALKNLVNFKEKMDLLGLPFLWQHRESFITAMKQHTEYKDINNLDGDNINKSELNKMLNFVLALIGHKWNKTDINATYSTIININQSGWMLSWKTDTYTWYSIIWGILKFKKILPAELNWSMTTENIGNLKQANI